MNTKPQSRGLERAITIYKALLSFYPPKYRHEYADQMVIIFKDLYRDYLATQGGIGIQFWFEMALDTCTSIVHQYFNLLKISFSKRFSSALSFTILTFFVTFFFVSMGMWIYNNLTSVDGAGIKSRLHAFVIRYERTLQTTIFDTIFSQAQLCNDIAEDDHKQVCRKQIGNAIGDALHEEELGDGREFSWPHDLFFVKQTGESFKQVGWDGELKDISHVVTKKNIKPEQSYLSLLLRHNCNYFRISSESYACEVYESVSLGPNSRGYVIRMYPFGEENDVLFAFFAPIVGLAILSDMGRGFFLWEGLPYVLLSFINIIIPIIVSVIAFYIFKRKKNSKK